MKRLLLSLSFWGAALCLSAFLPSLAEATHFRGGTLRYEHVTGRQVRFIVEAYFQRSYYGCPAAATCVGRTILEGNLTPGDGNSINPNLVVVDDDRTGGIIRVVGISLHTYGGTATTYNAAWGSCCWISGTSRSSWSLTVQVNFNNISPQINSATYYEWCVGTPWIQDVNAFDPDNDNPLTYVLSNPTAGMTISVSAAGIVTYTNPVLGYKVFTVTVTDSRGGVSYRDYLLNILASTTCVNNTRPPVITLNPASITVQPGQPACTDVTASDPDAGQAVRVTSILPAKTGATTTPSPTPTGNPITFRYCWTPAGSDEGTTHGIAIEVRDNGTPNLAAAAVFDITVSNQSPPTLTLAPTANPVVVNEGASVTFTVTAADRDTSINTFTLSGRPAFCTQTAVSATVIRVTCTPGFTDGTRDYTLVFTTTDRDPNPKTTTLNVTVRVVHVNRPPVIAGTPATTATEDVPYPYSPTASDPDGDPIRFALTSGPPGATIDPTTGKITWTPGDADVGKSFTFEVQVCDNATPPACVTQRWTVNALNVNDPPRITSTPPTTVTQNDTYDYTPVVVDPDPNERLNFKLTKFPPGATIDPATGKVTWKPGPGDAGKTFDFEIEVCDAATPPACVKQAWRVTVINVNDPPTITSTPPTAATEDQPYGYKPTGTDPDTGDTLNWKLTKSPTGATIDPVTGEVKWTPGDADAGKSVDFEIELCDAAGECVKQAWKTNVTNVNDPPRVSGNPPTTGTQGQSYGYTPTVTDPDPNETHTWKVTKGPQGLTIDPTTGKITWTPGPADGGREVEIEIEVCDAAGACAKQTWKVNVANVNDPPVITSTPPTTGKEDDPYNYTPTATDPDPNTTFTWKFTKNPSGATIDPATGEVRWIPDDSEGGKTVDFEIEVCDNATPPLCVKQPWKVAVTNVNDQPSITSTPPVEAYVGQSTIYTPTVSDADSGDTFTWKLNKAPQGATIDPATGKVTWTPSASDAGTEQEFEIEVCDSGTPPLCATQTYKLPVKQLCKVDADCPTDQICVQQTLGRVCVVPGCSSQNPKCAAATDFCKNGNCGANPCGSVTCKTDETCRPLDGKCVKSCGGVTCFPGTKCDGGTCIPDPCASTPCKQGEICDTSNPEEALCTADPCTSGSCKHGRVCSEGQCFDDPCPSMKCPSTTDRCFAGQCVPRPPCQVDSDCPAAEVCVNDRCYEPGCYTSTTTPRCSGPDQLCLGAVCSEDPCKANGGKQCPQDQFCRSTDGQCVAACAGVTCPAGQFCENGACKADPCATKQCAAGEVCIGGDCFRDRCDGGQACKHGRLCVPNLNRCVDDPCLNVKCPDPKQVCRLGQCEAPPSCKFDSDCPADNICVAGKCVVPACSAQKPCPAGELCENGKCLTDPCVGKTCAADEFCKGGACIKSCSGIFCPNGERCVDGRCQADPCASITCPAGETCRNGTCVKDECKPDSCKGGRLCDIDTCTTDPCSGITCPQGQTCQKGQCVGDKPCQTDVECPGLGVCIDKKCAPPTCYQTACKQGEVCIKGKCTADPCAGKTCAAGEFCRPTDGACIKVCPACPQGQICKDGLCIADPCQGVVCQNTEACADGKCSPNPCKTTQTRLCKFQRACETDRCEDDLCQGVTCPNGGTCQAGVCVNPASEVVPEPVGEKTDASEAVKETAAEAKPETAAETAKDNASKEVTGEFKSDSATGGDIGMIGGGCGCSSSSFPFAPLLFFFFFLPLLRRRRA